MRLYEGPSRKELYCDLVHPLSQGRYRGIASQGFALSLSPASRGRATSPPHRICLNTGSHSKPSDSSSPSTYLPRLQGRIALGLSYLPLIRALVKLNP
jgi:hypothetical protein